MGTTSLLPALVGLENATRLLLTSEFISGEDAKRMGLASEAVERVSWGVFAFNFLGPLLC